MVASVCLVNGQERMRVIIDNDFAGDPDGLFALAQLMKSTSVDLRAVIGSHLHVNENWTAKGQPSASTAADNARKLLEEMGMENACQVVAGSEIPLGDTPPVTVQPLMSSSRRSCNVRRRLLCMCCVVEV